MAVSSLKMKDLSQNAGIFRVLKNMNCKPWITKPKIARTPCTDCIKIQIYIDTNFEISGWASLPLAKTLQNIFIFKWNESLKNGNTRAFLNSLFSKPPLQTENIKCTEKFTSWSKTFFSTYLGIGLGDGRPGDGTGSGTT